MLVGRRLGPEQHSVITSRDLKVTESLQAKGEAAAQVMVGQQQGLECHQREALRNPQVSELRRQAPGRLLALPAARGFEALARREVPQSPGPNAWRQRKRRSHCGTVRPEDSMRLPSQSERRNEHRVITEFRILPRRQLLTCTEKGVSPVFTPSHRSSNIGAAAWCWKWMPTACHCVLQFPNKNMSQSLCKMDTSTKTESSKSPQAWGHAHVI